MRILLFDLDGTLVRTESSGRKALDAAVHKLWGVRNICGGFSLSGRTDLWNFSTAYRMARGRKPSGINIERLHQEYIKRLPRYVRQAVKDGGYVVSPGIQTLLKRISGRPGVMLGLGTGNMERGAEIKLAPSGLGRYFKFGGFGSGSLHRSGILKMAVAQAERIAGKRARLSEVYVIGDTPFDVAAGRQMGFKTGAVGTGFAQWDDLVKARPDFLARDFTETSKWIEWFQIK
ncbi:MAG: HAD family hydrolase [Elusimicrobiota bacterium]